MSYSEYRDLLPIDNIENGNEYIEALNWAFQNKKIKNIALTGPYGCGKSSIIETFLAEDEKRISAKEDSERKEAISKSALKISMATFLKGDCEEKIDIGSDEVEKGILKQLFYKVEPGRIPQSRYRKLHAISKFTVFIRVIVWLTLIGLLSDIFVHTVFDKFIEAIKNFLPSCLSAPIYTVVSTVLLLLLLSAVSTYLYITVISKFRVKEIKLPTDTTVKSGNEESDSVFNRNLDEIMYFFESTGYRTIFFEDLDRITEPKIFVHLRELNNLLNNDDAIKSKPIVFVYAVRDDIFSQKDRTKFFDFIIPVIPVMNSTNSGEILLHRLQEAKENGITHDISQGFVLDVAPYISDMRILQNIYNEFVVYKKTLRISQELSLSDEQILAMIIFKNLYPSDFADIQDERGVLKKAFDDKKEFLIRKKQDIQKQIDDDSMTINSANSEILKSIRELKYAMVVTLMGGFHRFEGFGYYSRGSVSVESFMSDTFDMTDIQKKDCNYINFYQNNYGSKNERVDENIINAYIKRWKAIKEFEENGLQKLKEEIHKLRDKQHHLSGMTLKKLVESYTTEEVLSDDVRNNKLLTFLLRRGYIDEKYANYINYFKGTSITKEDMNFILSVKDQSPKSFDFPLTKTSMVVERLQDYEFEDKAIYNFDLLEELLSQRSSTKLTAFIKQLADGNEISWRFIDEFVNITTYQNCFIQLLAENWIGMWDYIASNDTLTYERQLLYLRTMLDVSETTTIEAQNVGGCLTNYFEQHDDILQKLASCDISKIIAIIECINVSFDNLQIEGVPHEVLDFVFDNCYYNLNNVMIHSIVKYKNNSMTDSLNDQPYSTIVDLGYSPLTQYIQDNIATYVREIVLVHNTLFDKSEDIVDLLTWLKKEENLQVQLVMKEDFHLDSIEECAGDCLQEESDAWQPVWDALLSENIVNTSWENVIAYWKVYKLSDELKTYISTHVDELAEIDTSAIVDDFIGMFIMSDFEIEIEEKLIPILRMKTFNLDISSIAESTLKIMIGCNYFEFTVDHYSVIATLSFDIGLEYILKNQDAYMEQRDSISMSNDLLESLLFSNRFHQEYKTILFSEYAESYMTEKIALQMSILHVPITEDIFDAAYKCVGQGNHEKLLVENCTHLNADELEHWFREIGGVFAGFDVRTRRHDVTLAATSQNKLLAEHLQDIGYITSYEEINDTYIDPELEKETTRKVLKLRIKQVKQAT